MNLILLLKYTEIIAKHQHELSNRHEKQKANQMENRWSKTKDLRNELAAAAACCSLLFCFFFIFDFWLVLGIMGKGKEVGGGCTACGMPHAEGFFFRFLVSYSRLSHARDFGQVKRAQQAKERESEREGDGECEWERHNMAYPRTGGASWLPLHAAARPKPQPQQLVQKAAETGNKSYIRAEPTPGYPSHNLANRLHRWKHTYNTKHLSSINIYLCLNQSSSWLLPKLA